MVFKKIFNSSRALCILLALGLLGAMLVELDPLKSLENKVYDIMTGLRHTKTAAPVVIVAIDDASIQKIGTWPWPRCYMADMVRRLTGYGTHTLGICLLYSKEELNAGLEEIQSLRDSLRQEPLIAGKKTLGKIDKILAQVEKKLNCENQLIYAVKSARNVVLPLRFIVDPSAHQEAPDISSWLWMNSIDLKNSQAKQEAREANRIDFQGIFKKKAISAVQGIHPYSELSRKAGALGHLNMDEDRDHVIRSIPLLISCRDRTFLSFALQVARKYFGIRLNNIKPEAAGLQMNRLVVPTDRKYRMLIDYSRREADIQVFSFSDVLNEAVPPDAFRNKIVLIGITASGVASRYYTPLHSPATEVEIEAYAVENLINRKHVLRPAWAFGLEVAVLVYFTFFLTLVIPKVNPRIGALILGIFLITWIGVSGLLFMAYGYWLHVIAPVVLAAVGFIIIVRKKIAAGKQQEHVELSKNLGLSLQSQGMLDMAFDKFLKCPIEDKSVKELLYNLGLDFERKRMFNKALAVYRHILNAGQFKDIQARMKSLKSIEKALVLSAGSASKKPGLLLEKATMQPTLGRYEIVKELGQGAMGTVYLGKDPSINREVAIKTLNYTDVDPGQLNEVKSRFFREAEAAGKLSHPNIVTIYDVGEDYDMAYIAMELLRGKDLTYYCQKEKLLATKRVLHVIASVAEALDYAHHQGVVHRDIKPANIILQDDDQVKVADFGIARVMSASKTQTGVIFGTPNYMSPEQVAGKKVDGRSDLFSLGVVFYELLSAKKPFQGENLTSLMYAIANGSYFALVETAPKTPPCCLEIIDKLLAKAVTKRYKTAAQLLEHIRRCQELVS
jgi:CHASE2 domain-containing sensor protein/predicted Ser/Thr protein kinase